MTQMTEQQFNVVHSQATAWELGQCIEWLNELRAKYTGFAQLNYFEKSCYRLDRSRYLQMMERENWKQNHAKDEHINRENGIHSTRQRLEDVADRLS